MKTLRLAALCPLAVLASGHAYAADIPPHTAVDLYGVQAYSDAGPGSVAAGEDITFYASNTFPYNARIYRLGNDPASVAGDHLIASLGSFGANPQAIHPGSYVHIENQIHGKLSGLTLEAWLQTAPYVRGWRGIITQYSSFSENGFGLFLYDDKVAFYLGTSRDNISTTQSVLAPSTWYHIVATWDGKEKVIWVNGAKVARWPVAGPVNLGTEPLRLGAYGHNGKAGMFLNGTLAVPAIYNRALTAEEIHNRYTAPNIEPPEGSHVLAAWPFDEERGDAVRDVSGNSRHGQIINHGIWQVGGPRFNADVPRFGYDPATDMTRGHGLRFADDQLVDCGWNPTHTWRVPITAKSGVYVLRLQFEWGGTSYYHVPFVVRRTSWAERAPIAVVASTHTWWAYNSVSFPRPLHGFQHTVQEFVPQRYTPLTSLYRDHAAGQGSYYVGLRIPNPVADPYLSWGEGDGVSHLLPVERLLHVWLEKQGYDFEVITDLDLHRDPNILDGRKVVALVGHNEYWSIPMYRNLEQYLARGGNLLIMNGNTGFWRVSFNEDLTVMEGRKVDAPGNRVPNHRRGERFHSQDGLPGGLARETGIPAWRLTGLETAGWVEHKNEQFGPLVINAVDHPLFAGTGISAGDTLAYGGGGHELDALLPTIFSVGGGSGLALSAVPQEPSESNIALLGHFTTQRPDLGITVLDWWLAKVTAQTVASDVILWQRPEGGEVFNFGSIRSAVGLADERFAKLVANVLARFGVERTSASAITLALPGDFDGDGYVGMDDFFRFADNFGKRKGETGWHGKYDINKNDAVDFDDFFIFAQYFGQRAGVTKPVAKFSLPEMLLRNPKLRTLAESHPLLGPALASYLAALPKFALLQNYPNPFNPNTTIQYSLAEPALADISVYSAAGQLVRKLVDEEQTVGAHTAIWDGTDSNGRHVASGLYLYRITTGNFTDVKRMLLLK